MARDSDLALSVDRIACDGYGMCAEMLPELIDLDEWGYPIVADRVVPTKLLSLARDAVETCPVLALRLVTRGDLARPFSVTRAVKPPVFVRSR